MLRCKLCGFECSFRTTMNNHMRNFHRRHDLTEEQSYSPTILNQTVEEISHDSIFTEPEPKNDSVFDGGGGDFGGGGASGDFGGDD